MVLVLCATPVRLVRHKEAQERDLSEGRRMLVSLMNPENDTGREPHFNASRMGDYLHANRIAQSFSRDTCPSLDTCPIHARSTA